MRMTEKIKRRLTVGGGIAICAGLLAAISLQFAKAPIGEDAVPEKESGAAEAVVTPSDTKEINAADSNAADSMEESGSGGEKAELTIQPDVRQGESQTDQPVDSRPAQTGQAEQSIQPEVEKPELPDEEVLSNPEQKPDGTIVDTAPEPVEHGTYVPPEDNGDGNSGGGLPGFGSVPNGGTNTAVQAEDMYENGNKIGNMD